MGKTRDVTPRTPRLGDCNETMVDRSHETKNDSGDENNKLVITPVKKKRTPKQHPFSGTKAGRKKKGKDPNSSPEEGPTLPPPTTSETDGPKRTGGASSLANSPLAKAFARTPKRDTNSGAPDVARHGVQHSNCVAQCPSMPQGGVVQTPETNGGPVASSSSHDSTGMESQRCQSNSFTQIAKDSRKKQGTSSGTTTIRNAFTKSVSRQTPSCRKRNMGDVPNNDDEQVVHKTPSKRTRKDSSSHSVNSEKEAADITWCKACRKRLNPPEVIDFSGDHAGAVEEFVALVDPKLTSSLCNQDDLTEQPQFKITSFTFYDEFQHVCPFDGGLIESDIPLFMSGYMKSICAEDPGEDDGVPVTKVGPIVSWWTTGYDGGENVVLGVTTAFAEYVLMQPSTQYKPYIDNMQEKIYLVKVIMELLIDDDELAFEDLLSKVEEATGLPATVGPFSEETVHKHAQFLVDHIQAYDAAGSTHDYPLLGSSFVQSLMRITGSVVRENAWNPKQTVPVRKGGRKVKDSTMVVQTFLSPIVEETITNLFAGKDVILDGGSKRKNRCGRCEACLASDCMECVFCRNMKKYGGSGTFKQCCIRRRCGDRHVKGSQEHNDVEEDAMDAELAILRSRPFLKRRYITTNPVEHHWLRRSSRRVGNRFFYGCVRIVNKIGDGTADFTVKVGDDVQVWSVLPDTIVYVGRVIALYETEDAKAFAHIVWFRRYSETLFGSQFKGVFERQVFLTKECDDVPLVSIESTCKVQFVGEVTHDVGIREDYKCVGQCDVDHCTFLGCEVKLVEALKKAGITCACCSFPYSAQDVTVEDDAPYAPGDYVLIKPNGFPQRVKDGDKNMAERQVSIDVAYPERYRKQLQPPTVHDSRLPEPYIVGAVIDLHRTFDLKASFKVRRFYRPEDLPSSGQDVCDVHQLYQSNDTCEVNLEDVVAKCDVVYSASGVHGTCFDPSKPPFYFNKLYDSGTGIIDEVPPGGQISKHEYGLQMEEVRSSEPLRAVDVYCGTGSLMRGLGDSGVAEPVLAVSNSTIHQATYHKNFPDCHVPRQDPKAVLKRICVTDSGLFAGQVATDNIGLICGSPSFESLKTFRPLSASDVTHFRESQVATFLSYCSYLNPRFVILAAERSLVRYSSGAVLVFVLKCLFDLGYQVSCGVLQDGCYGVPQRFRRLFIFGSASCSRLPSFPEPTHAFEVSDDRLAIAVDGRRYSTALTRATPSAPYRRMTLRDAISDLPLLTNKTRPQRGSNTEFARRFKRPTLSNHQCKEMKPLEQARIDNVPFSPGADWRDLPNKSVRLSDNTLAHALVYTHRDPDTGTLRGVCACVNGDTKKCDPMFRQEQTLIPWTLVHTADRQNHWVGLYGRLQWDGYLHTVVANPEPMSKRGPVLHPEENRVLTVRECARIQGYPDDFVFEGSILEQYQQVASCVPPLVAQAIGAQFKKVMV
ncbi:DNA (cytosine-5)-methyltransferase PliMCI-like [Ornithodoros turicata]|uniref:DNA (cytosine-5)-methyltransferase PliMCI-like n=1 Tax=Ornithodoros turicata TaxID=34597 RepID=UPI0031393FFD